MAEKVTLYNVGKRDIALKNADGETVIIRKGSSCENIPVDEAEKIKRLYGNEISDSKVPESESLKAVRAENLALSAEISRIKAENEALRAEKEAGGDDSKVVKNLKSKNKKLEEEKQVFEKEIEDLKSMLEEALKPVEGEGDK